MRGVFTVYLHVGARPHAMRQTRVRADTIHAAAAIWGRGEVRGAFHRRQRPARERMPDNAAGTVDWALGTCGEPEGTKAP